MMRYKYVNMCVAKLSYDLVANAHRYISKFQIIIRSTPYLHGCETYEYLLYALLQCGLSSVIHLYESHN